jgi:hypothetical protein
MKKTERTLTTAESVTELAMTTMDFYLLGLSEVVPHAVSAKVALGLLDPPPKKNAAERASTSKHSPWEEFREAAYQFEDHEDTPTRLYLTGRSFRAAVASVALDIPGARRTQIARLTSVPLEKVPLFGIPRIVTQLVKSSDMKRTPDVRTLPALMPWAIKVGFQFPEALISAKMLLNLVANAGLICGVGDGRPEKGKLTRGRWVVVDHDDERWHRIAEASTRKAQDDALADPEFFDRESENLLRAFIAARARRGVKPTDAAVPPSLRQLAEVNVAKVTASVASSNGDGKKGRKHAS